MKIYLKNINKKIKILVAKQYIQESFIKMVK